MLDRGIAYLRGTLNAPDELDELAAEPAGVHAVRAGRGGSAGAEPGGRAVRAARAAGQLRQGYLALALGLIDDEAAPERIKTLLADLSGKAITSATSAHWEEGQPDFWNMNTDTRTTAIVLDALAKLDPENALGPNAVRWLMTARKANRWETTQENAWAIIGLTDWMAATGELEGNYDWQVRLNGQTTRPGNGDTADRPGRDPAPGGHQATAARPDERAGHQRTAAAGQTGEGQIYYTAHLRTYQPVPEIAAAEPRAQPSAASTGWPTACRRRRPRCRR